MKKAFSLLELIIVIVLLAIITSFIAFKANDFFNASTKSKIKSEIALIKSSIQKMNSKKVLLDEEPLEYLDNESINAKSFNLFSNVLEFPLKSTTQALKKEGYWIKTSSEDYQVYLDETIFLKFSYENQNFLCKSEVNLCKDYE